MRLFPSASMLLGLCLAVAPSLPAGAVTPLVSETQMTNTQELTVDAASTAVRRTRNSHRGSGRRDFVRYVFMNPAS